MRDYIRKNPDTAILCVVAVLWVLTLVILRPSTKAEDSTSKYDDSHLIVAENGRNYEVIIVDIINDKNCTGTGKSSVLELVVSKARYIRCDIYGKKGEMFVWVAN